MSEAIPLPPRPNVEHYKKLAKELQTACKAQEAGAVRLWARRWLKRLARHKRAATPLDVLHEVERTAEDIVRRWQGLASKQERAAQCLLSDAQFFLAREHGFSSWPAFVRHLEGLATADSPVAAFEAAADAIIDGDAGRLRRLLRKHPELARARSTREHRSTLLHYVSANGVEDFRQRTPENIVEITRLLLDAGADVNAESEAYGGGSTALGLAATSVHPEQAGVQMPLLEALLEHGARLDQEGAAGNGSSFLRGCLANGQPGAARFFADRGVRLDLMSAAALGDLTAVRRCFQSDHEQVAAAFEYACWYGQRDAVALLLDLGVDPAIRVSEGKTGLHCAAYGAHIELIALLLRRGTPVGATEDSYGAAALDVALWVWDNAKDPLKRERCYECVALLAKAGAVFDPRQWGGAGDTLPPMAKKIDADARMRAALGGG